MSLHPAMIFAKADIHASLHSDGRCPYDFSIGYIDCRKIKMIKPGGPAVNQWSVFSGKKRFLCLIYKSITIPDRLLMSMVNPFKRPRTDLTLLCYSGWEDVMTESFILNRRKYCVYGDSTYLLRPWMVCAFITAFASEK